MTDTKSVEQRVWEGGLGVFTEAAAKTFYLTFMSQLRVPTVVRRFQEGRKSFLDRVPSERFHIDDNYKNLKDGTFFGGLAGFAGVCAADVLLAKYAVENAMKGDYWPLAATVAVPLVTNALSSIYEHGRAAGERQNDLDKFKPWLIYKC